MSAQDEFDKMLANNKEHGSTHPEDAHDSTNDDSDRENNKPVDSPNRDNDSSAANVRQGRASIPSKKQHGNTGPKGVIRDAQVHRDAQLKTNSTVSLPQTTSQPPRQVLAQTALAEEDESEQQQQQRLEDGFMENWRRDRLRQLQEGPEGEWVTSVDGDGYLAAVDGSEAGTVVVVFIYDESSQVSQLVETCLSKVARTASRNKVKFVKLRYQEAEMEPAGVPALLAYRNGDKFAGLVPLVDEIPDDAELNETTLESMLQRHQIL